MQALPLKGIRVLELATVIAAPTASRVLCAYGADVVKIEKLTGDEMRRAGITEQVICEDYKNPMFTVHNSNKKLISINLKTPEGLEIVSKLLEKTDVFITNVRMASLQRMKLDYDSLKEKFPKLIYAHFAGYGPKGPEAHLPGFDSTAFWMKSGPLADWQVAGSRPMKPSYGFGDMATSSAFVSGILMAILGRQQTGKGTLVRTSLYASGIWCNSSGVVSAQPPFEKELRPDPKRPPDPFAFHYLCKDGEWFGIFCNEYAQDYMKIAKILGIEKLYEDERYRDLRLLHSSGEIEHLIEAVNEAFLQKGSREWYRIFNENNVACQLVCRAKDVYKDPQALENNYMERVTFADGVTAVLPNPPIAFSNFSRREYEPTGKIGEHTDEILTSLGYTASTIESLKNINAIR